MLHGDRQAAIKVAIFRAVTVFHSSWTSVVKEQVQFVEVQFVKETCYWLRPASELGGGSL